MNLYFVKGNFVFLSIIVFILTGCNAVVLNSSGDIANQHSHLIIISTLLISLIIIPVIILIIIFSWHYRENNNMACYRPNWNYSVWLELIIWGVPLLIIIILGSLTWINTHKLDPYRKLTRLDAQHLISSNIKPLTIEVVALDWKWLFIYPEQKIAVINEVAAPINIPIHFKITASSVMNSFYIPALAGQIYAMPGMQTELNAVINKSGKYNGFSANYSGRGFSDMHFKFYGLNNSNFNEWIKMIKLSKNTLQQTDYQLLEKPSINNSVQYFSMIDPILYEAIIKRCIGVNKICVFKTDKK